MAKQSVTHTTRIADVTDGIGANEKSQAQLAAMDLAQFQLLLVSKNLGSEDALTQIKDLVAALCHPKTVVRVLDASEAASQTIAIVGANVARSWWAATIGGYRLDGELASFDSATGILDFNGATEAPIGFVEGDQVVFDYMPLVPAS